MVVVVRWWVLYRSSSHRRQPLLVHQRHDLVENEQLDVWVPVNDSTWKWEQDVDVAVDN
jgi:hypothetical protein